MLATSKGTGMKKFSGRSSCESERALCMVGIAVGTMRWKGWGWGVERVVECVQSKMD